MIKKLLSCVREYKKSSLLTPLFTGLEVVLDVVIPITIAGLIDNGIKAGDFNYILRSGLLLVFLALLSLLFGAMSARFGAYSAAGFAKNLRKDMYYNVQTFSFSNIDKYSTSSIVTRLTTDVANLQNSYGMILRIAVRSPLMLIFSLVMAFSIHASLALVFALSIPVLGIGLFVLVKFTHPIFRKVFETYDKLNNVVQENLHGIRVVKSFVREDHEIEKFDGVSEEIYKYFTKAEKLLALNNPLMQFTSFACMLLISWLGAQIIVKSGASELTTGSLTSLFTYTMQILSSLMMLSMVFVMITMSRASAERCVEILNEVPTIKDAEDPVYNVPDGSVEFDNVCFKYSASGDKNVLNNIDLRIDSGQTIGVVGGTGSSKSTLVQLIPRLYDVTEGSVKVGGVDVRQYDIETLRNSVAMVLQKNELFSGTIKENLRWGNENATDEEIVEACRLAQADKFINEMPDKYDTYIEQGGTNVSGGQKQRLCIARALLKKPKILILDDSTSAVDTATDALIRSAFRQYIPETTKIIIAQRIASVEDADKIIVMDEGEITAFGTHEELLETSEIYKEVYYSQVKGGDEDPGEVIITTPPAHGPRTGKTR